MLQNFFFKFNMFIETNGRFLFIFIERKNKSKKNEKILGRLVDNLYIG